MTNHHPTQDTKTCYIMQKEDIERFADTLADGFSEYSLFKYIFNGKNLRDKMRLFWTISLTVVPDTAICIADSKEANSVLVYFRPNSEEPGPLDYLKAGGLKMFYKIGLGSIIRLLRFGAETQRIAKRYKTSNDGYLWAFATRLDKQGQHYATPLIKTLLNHLDASGEGCYLETMKAEDVALYKHFSFQLKEQTTIQRGNLPLFAMLKSGNESKINL